MIFADALVWDAHSGFLPNPEVDLENLRIWRNAGVNYLSINVGFDIFPWEHTIRILAAFRHWIFAHGDTYTLVRSVDDIRRAKAEGKMAITFDIEGMNALEGRVEMVELYHDLGVRQMLFAYNRNNLAGGGCHDENVGLTHFGRTVIDEMNRVGIVVDVSHCSHRTSMEAMEYSQKPVVFSHSNPRALCGYSRNILDDQIKACAATGGVIGVVGISTFLGEEGASAERLADHIEYLIERAGPRHVGIGLDYGFPVNSGDINEYVRANPDYWPTDQGYGQVEITYTAPSQLLELTEVLLRHGHSEEIIRGVLGENFVRVASEVWR